MMQISEQDGIVIYILENKYLQDVDPPNLVTTFKDHLARGNRKFVFNCARIKDIFSPVVGILAVVARRAEETDTVIRLSNVNPFVEKVLRASRLDRFFEIHQTVADAVASLK